MENDGGARMRFCIDLIAPCRDRAVLCVATSQASETYSAKLTSFHTACQDNKCAFPRTSHRAPRRTP